MLQKSYRDLIVWQKSLDLVVAIYEMVKELPKAEQFGLASQMQRAAVSIPSNIAEGSKRLSKRDYLQFLHIANGSAAELETQLFILHRVYPKVATNISISLLVEIQKMLAVLIAKLTNTYNLKPGT